MFVSIESLDASQVAALWVGEPVAPVQAAPTPRAEHARFLGIAAARRLRARQRAELHRDEDAAYWKAIAPAALHRAAAMREHVSFAPLP